MKGKRQITALAMGLALASVAITANADSTVVKTGSVQNADLIYGSNLLRMEGNTGYGMATLDGTLLTGMIYGRNFNCSDGYVIASEPNNTILCTGVFTKTGKNLIPFQYGDVKVLNKHWILGFVLEEATANQYDYESWGFGDDADSYYLIKTVDIYYVDDTGAAASCVKTLTREEYMDAEAYGSYINVQSRTDSAIHAYDSAYNQLDAEVKSLWDEAVEWQDRIVFRDNGQEGLKDAEGNVVMAPAFKYLNDFRGGYATVSTGEKEGLIDWDGNVIVPAEYDTVKTSYYMPVDEEGNTTGYNAHGYFAVVQDGKVGFVDANGNVTCAPKYAKDYVEINGASAILKDMEGNTIIQAADGVETVVEGYESVRVMEYSAGMYYEVKDTDYNSGMIDWHGNVIFPCENSDVELSGDGQYVLVSPEYDVYDIYQITYTGEAPAADVPAETEAPAADVPAETEAPAADVPAETEAPAADTAKETSAAETLVESVIALLNADAEANRSSCAVLLGQAVVSLGDGQDSVSVLLNNAKTLLETEGSDLGAVLPLLNSAVSLMK